MRSICFRLFIAFTFLAFSGVGTSCNRAACYVKPKEAKKKHARYNSHQYK